MIHRLVVIVALSLLASGCTDEGEASRTTAVEVQSGQRYRFVQHSAAETEQVLEVKQVTPHAVRYEVRTLVNQEAEAQPLELRFPLRAPAGLLPDGEDEDLTIGERVFPCRVVARDDALIYYVRDGDHQGFPGIIKLLRDGEVLYELVAVEDP